MGIIVSAYSKPPFGQWIKEGPTVAPLFDCELRSILAFFERVYGISIKFPNLDIPPIWILALVDSCDFGSSGCFFHRQL